MHKQETLGGTDGVRGRYTEDQTLGLMNESTVALLTYSLINIETEKGNDGPIIISRDTRPSSKNLKDAALSAASLFSGHEVIDLDVAPTPTAQKVAEQLGALATVVITASHNPYTDNGWKGMPQGRKPYGTEVDNISERFWALADNGLAVPNVYGRTTSEKPELLDWYADSVVEDITKEFGEKPLSDKLFVVDGSYGAGQELTPAILRRLGATVETFACDGQGLINDGCGAADLYGVKDYLAQHPEITFSPNFVGAVANDGDADRLMAIGVTWDNNIPILVEVNGNHVMSALAEPSYGIREPGIVGTEYTNTGVKNWIEAKDIEFEYCANGDVNVTNSLQRNREKGWRRGGEFTGHLVDLNWLTSGDGVRMAAWFAAYAATNGVTFGDIYQNLPLWAEKMSKVEFSDSTARKNIKQHPAVQAAITIAEAELGDSGRVVLRPSGTEPLVRIWGESLDKVKIGRIVSTLSGIVQLHASSKI